MAPLDFLSDEVLEQLCLCLPGRELLRFAATTRQTHAIATTSAVIWSSLSTSLLGEAFCSLHSALARRRGRELDVGFWSSLFRRGYKLEAARWSLDIRAAFLEPGPERRAPAWASRLPSDAGDAARSGSLVGSGHASVTCGRLVVKTGGLRPGCKLQHLHSVAFDLEKLTMRDVTLVEDSEKPERRIRHASCEVRPGLTGGRSAVLVLGGCHDQKKTPCEGGLRMLHLLELLDDGGSRGRWHSLPADGECPGAIWHHICGSFDGGRKVVVFGGDWPQSDPEFEHIRDRKQPAGFVYILDVEATRWQRVSTKGPSPTWRSLHAGFTHRDVSSHSERLVVLGGAAAHVPIYSSSDALAEMRGHALDLKTFEWQPQSAWDEEALPAPRLRCSVDKVGEWLMLYGGHGEDDQLDNSTKMHKLNLRTLRWKTLELYGREAKWPAAAAATLTAGLFVGGVRFGMLGITPVPKMDVLTLCENAVDGAEMRREEEHDRLAVEAAEQRDTNNSDEDSSEDSDGDAQALLSVLLRDNDGNAQRVVIQRAVLQRLLARHRGGAARQSGGDASDDGPDGGATRQSSGDAASEDGPDDTSH